METVVTKSEVRKLLKARLRRCPERGPTDGKIGALEMETVVTKAEVRKLLRARLKRCPELGFSNLIVNTVLEPPHPFQPNKRRLPRKGFLLVAASLVAIVGVFVAFNLWP
jgi:hypothetical protein